MRKYGQEVPAAIRVQSTAGAILHGRRSVFILLPDLRSKASYMSVSRAHPSESCSCLWSIQGVPSAIAQSCVPAPQRGIERL